jgi:hypothetical protein
MKGHMSPFECCFRLHPSMCTPCVPCVGMMCVCMQMCLSSWYACIGKEQQGIVKPEHMHREGTTRNSDPVGLLHATCILRRKGISQAAKLTGLHLHTQGLSKHAQDVACWVMVLALALPIGILCGHGHVDGPANRNLAVMESLTSYTARIRRLALCACKNAACRRQWPLQRRGCLCTTRKCKLVTCLTC